MKGQTVGRTSLKLMRGFLLVFLAEMKVKGLNLNFLVINGE